MQKSVHIGNSESETGYAIRESPKGAVKAEPTAVVARSVCGYRQGMSVQQAVETGAVPVPFLDLSHLHAPLKEALLAEFGKLLDTGVFTNGPRVMEFERAFAAYCGTDYCIGVS